MFCYIYNFVRRLCSTQCWQLHIACPLLLCNAACFYVNDIKRKRQILKPFIIKEEKTLSFKSHLLPSINRVFVCQMSVSVEALSPNTQPYSGLVTSFAFFVCNSWIVLNVPLSTPMPFTANSDIVLQSNPLQLNGWNEVDSRFSS